MTSPRAGQTIVIATNPSGVFRSTWRWLLDAGFGAAGTGLPAGISFALAGVPKNPLTYSLISAPPVSFELIPGLPGAR